MAYLSSSPLTLTQTIVDVPADTDTLLIAPNVNRRYLLICNIGLGDVVVGINGSVTALRGYPLVAADAPGRQGGGLSYEASTVPTNGFVARGAATTIVVVEG